MARPSKTKTATRTRSKSGKSTRGRKKKASSGGMGQFFQTLFRWGFVLGLWAAIALAVILVWFSRDLPTITASMVFERRPTIIIKANDGTVVDRYGDIRGDAVTVDELPPHVVNAVLSTEDRRFYSHFGIDPIGIARAFAINTIQGNLVQGGSTITQQLAKNLFLSRERTMKRKIQEAMLALWLEQKLSKDEILSAYLNRVYLGGGAYGIDAAARIYFDKPAKDLSVREAATLAGLLKAPSRYSPNSNPELAEQRTRVVLFAMKDAGFLKDDEYQALLAAAPTPTKETEGAETLRYFTDYVVAQIEDLIGVPTSDIIVETTLDRDIQAAAESSINRALEAYEESNKVSQGAAVVMALDGAIVAIVGGRDYDLSEYNRATHSLRPPGSAFKPIVYLAALEHGWAPESLIVDEPITEGRYRPQNYGNEYFGEVTLIEALTRSLNTVAVNLMRDTGPDQVIGLARRLGITAPLESNLSLALGSSGISMIEMTTAYATLGRGGQAVEPFTVLKIEDREGGRVLYEQPVERSARQVVSRGYVYQLTGMMQSAIQYGTGRAAAGPYHAAGKTGTSQEFRDAWFIGFTPSYAASVWFGNDDNTPMRRVTGAMIPAPVWRDIMTVATSKPAKTYYTVREAPSVNFSDFLGRIIGSGNDDEDPLYQRPRLQHRNPQSPEYTPRGRHQYNLND